MLDLYLNQRFAGAVEVDELGAYTLRYADEWLSSSRGFPLSMSLPLAEQTYSGKRVENVLRGYLPESKVVLDSWSKRYRISDPSDPISVLAKVGEDVAGAAQFVPHDENIATAELLIELDDAEIAELIADARVTGGSMPHIERVPRLSLAGMQPKFALHRLENGKWALPAGRAASTHIFKPGRPELDEIERLETALMRAARQCGIPTAEADVMTFGDETTYVTTRYDRLTTDHGIARVHQEDFAQAMGISPGQKYEDDGGPSAAQYVNLIRETSSAPTEDIATFVRLTAFNVAVGNADAHAKNFGLLIAPSEHVRFAPAYDISSLAPYPGFGQELAFSIGGERRYKAIELAHWQKFARRSGLNADEVVAQVHAVWSRVPDVVGDELKRASVDRTVSGPVEELFPSIESRTRMLEQRSTIVPEGPFFTHEQQDPGASGVDLT